MLRQTRYHQALHAAVALFTAALLASCSDELTPGDIPPGKVHLVLGAPDFQDVSGDAQEAATRALPEGFATYGSLYSPILPAYAQIQGFFASASADPVQPVFLFSDNDGKRSWSANVPIKADENVYFFGFLPREDTGGGSIAPRNGDYANGVVMTLSNVNAVTSSDVCVVVGVLRNDNNTDPITSLDMASRLGKFDFMPQTGTDNYLYLLADHLYCSLHFKMKIDATYNELRTIRVKKASLLVSDDAEAVKSINATVTLVANTSAEDPLLNPLSDQAGGSVVFAVSERGTSAPAILYNCADDSTHPDGIELTTSLVSLRGFFAPGFNERFILETIYDVYDRRGNLIRKDETARNTLRPVASLTHGQEYTYNITVKPTYLYMLSEPDLDSPTFSIE